MGFIEEVRFYKAKWARFNLKFPLSNKPILRFHSKEWQELQCEERKKGFFKGKKAQSFSIGIGFYGPPSSEFP